MVSSSSPPLSVSLNWLPNRVSLPSLPFRIRAELSTFLPSSTSSPDDEFIRSRLWVARSIFSESVVANRVSVSTPAPPSRSVATPTPLRPKSSPRVKFEITSLPSPPLNLSAPASPLSVSLPSPPISVSSPAWPCRLSLPTPPSIMSSPPPPVIVSPPASPKRMSSPEPLLVLPSASTSPAIVSLPAPPKIVSLPSPPNN